MPTAKTSPRRPLTSREREMQKRQKVEIVKTDESQRPFTKMNFILMSGGGSSIEGGFNPDIFSTRRIVVGPTVSFLGFLLMAFAIIYRPKKDK